VEIDRFNKSLGNGHEAWGKKERRYRNIEEVSNRREFKQGLIRGEENHGGRWKV